jgi:hypothetical protein
MINKKTKNIMMKIIKIIKIHPILLIRKNKKKSKKLVKMLKKMLLWPTVKNMMMRMAKRRLLGI